MLGCHIRDSSRRTRASEEDDGIALTLVSRVDSDAHTDDTTDGSWSEGDAEIPRKTQRPATTRKATRAVTAYVLALLSFLHNLQSFFIFCFDAEQVYVLMRDACRQNIRTRML